ncbi:MAG: hypothetical protein AUJ52_09700 [Elusimicrobia bacterium CG1_02_63_36]|nr:MAG: hypothetical protein AUJ52_09700 [Elusimicrobia bacterium CG1_02_63_36]PIP83528.1 MAG: hypothetical protein COR54_08720 [Elusimicrobia bacterium CG22_combo_CG10-13_8_21_14_all_63_91]PJA13108.1 MAG: hypothetical protein COX66_15570 [Elusimicrobia bacterium CG_4_10_14_0_2_um_filter_63_34]PJB26033.1 MAG: hypothetical protein CO113_05325 [Elusimicrobia bacterium CG_4_9_14_3_um_filter_62_55]
MPPIERLLKELDGIWPLKRPQKIRLDIIGSGALMLQSDYTRSTKDGDVFELKPLEELVRKTLLDLAGKKSRLQAKLHMYLDIVPNGLPLLPARPLFHRIALSKNLEHFELRALDPVDVAVSKLPRFNANDRTDVQSMIERGLISHQRLIARFRDAVDRFAMDARAELLPKYIERLHSIEHAFFNLPPTPFDLPDWMDR